MKTVLHKLLRLLACAAAGGITGGTIYYGMAGFGGSDRQAGMTAVVRAQRAKQRLP